MISPKKTILSKYQIYKTKEIYTCKICQYVADTRHQSCILTHLQDRHSIYRNKNFIDYLDEYNFTPNCACNQCHENPVLKRKGIEFNLFATNCPNKGRFNNPCCIEFYLFRGIKLAKAIEKISAIQSKKISSKHKICLKNINSGNNNPMSLVSLTKRLGSVEKAKDYLKKKGKKYSGENSPFYGKTHSDETLRKLAKIRSNIPKNVTKPELIIYGVLASEKNDFNENSFQYPIGKYIIDFCFNNKVIEVYGNYFHNTLKFKYIDKEQKDKEKIKFLKEKGYKVLIVYENEIITSIQSVVSKIRTFINED